MTWQVISPDLTWNDPKYQIVPGNPITRDVTGEEVFSTIYAMAESLVDRNVLWSGANDGPVYVTRDGGKNWKNVTPKDLPPGGRIQNIDASAHQPGRAYIAAYRFLGSDTDFRLDRHTVEFDAWKWAPLEDAEGLVIPFKAAVYGEVANLLREVEAAHEGSQIGSYPFFREGQVVRKGQTLVEISQTLAVAVTRIERHQPMRSARDPNSTPPSVPPSRNAARSASPQNLRRDSSGPTRSRSRSFANAASSWASCVAQTESASHVL